jgi:hypothetical protein
MIKENTRRGKMTGIPYNPAKDHTLPKIEPEPADTPAEYTQEMIDAVEAETEQIVAECSKNHQDFGRLLKETEEQTAYWVSRNKELKKN